MSSFSSVTDDQPHGDENSDDGPENHEGTEVKTSCFGKRYAEDSGRYGCHQDCDGHDDPEKHCHSMMM